MLNNKGFTLVELMAVIAILAIILVSAGLAVTSVINRQKNRLSDEKIDVIKDAAITYVQNKKYYMPSCKKGNTFKSITPAQVDTLNTTIGNSSKRNNFKNLNADTTFVNSFKTAIDVDSEKCFRFVSVKTLYDEGFVEKIDTCITSNNMKYSTLVVYSLGDANNEAGTLVAVPSQHLCE